MFPRKLVYLISFISIFLLCIPIYYGVTYSTNKVDVFATEIQEITEPNAEGKPNKIYSLTRMNHKDFKEFDLELEALEFNLEGNKNAKFKITASNENVQGGKIINSIEFKIALAANWIKFYQTSSSYSSIQAKYLDNDEYHNNSTNLYVNGLEPLTNRTNYFIPFPKPTTYVLVKYTVKMDDGKLNNVAYLLDYAYGDYRIVQGGYPA